MQDFRDDDDFHRGSPGPEEIHRRESSRDGEPFDDLKLLENYERTIYNFTLPDGIIVNQQCRYDDLSPIPGADRPKKRFWPRRPIHAGFISIEDMLDLGVTGPMIRAAGIPLDIRKTEPYSNYEKFDFKVATRTENDVYARYRVRMEEMRQSARIIVQAMEGMPEGAFQADAPHVVLPDREKMKTQMEALIYHFKIVTEGFRVPAGEAYQAVESPRGEIAYYIVSDGTSKPYRVHMRTPSFANLMALPPLLEGTLIADSIASLGSMDFVLGDTDR
jgi:NADH-quinone oxidoreductase subunit D